ncbi:MAG: ABC transporter permease [Succinivibrio sp.]|nr:ABC transporter permease [Succinivibrio sp.]
MMLIKLALRDLSFDRLMSFCLVAAIAAVIAPLLLLFALRFGILNHLYAELRDNPQNLELRMLQGYQLKPEFFSKLRGDPRVGFVIEMTRALSVTCDVSSQGRARTMIETIPTAQGDPLLALSSLTGDLKNDEAVVSARLAQELKLEAGSKLKVAISRQVNGRREVGVQNFTVTGIVPTRYAPRECVYLALPVITAMEDYRDGFNPQLFSDGSKLNGVRTSYAKARLYARSLEDVPSLASELGSQYKLQDASGSIAEIEAIGRVLSFVFFTIALTSISGGVLAYGGLVLTNLARKEMSIAQLELMGLSRRQVLRLTLYEGLILGVLAYLVSVLLFLIGQGIFNTYFGTLLKSSSVVALLEPYHLMLGLILSFSVVAALTLLVTYLKLRHRSVALALRQV